MGAAALRWYVVHSRPHAEETALRHLRRQGFAAFLPRYLKRRHHARRVEQVPAALFPRYLFVRMDVAEARWRAISSTTGVSHLVCVGGSPAPVPEGIVEDIQGRTADDGFVPVAATPFARGDRVQVLAGALADRTGLFDCASDEERVFLLLDMLGREVRIEVPAEAVAPAA